MRWGGLGIALLAAALFVGCGLLGDDDGNSGPTPTVDPATVGTVELSDLPPDGTVIVVNLRYYLMWQAAKEPITTEETTLEALQEQGITEGEPLPAGPLVVGATPAAPPPRWAKVVIEGASEDDPVRTLLYVIVDNEARQVQPQPLVGISEFGIADGSDPSAAERVQLPDSAPAPATASPTP